MPATRELLTLQSVDGDLAVHHARLSEIAPLLGDDSALRALARRLASEQSEVDAALPGSRTLTRSSPGSRRAWTPRKPGCTAAWS